MPWNVAQETLRPRVLRRLAPRAKSCSTSSAACTSGRPCSRSAHGAALVSVPRRRRYDEGSGAAFRKRYKSIRRRGLGMRPTCAASPRSRTPEHAAQFFQRRAQELRRLRDRGLPTCSGFSSQHMVLAQGLQEDAFCVRIWGLHNYRDANPRGRSLGGKCRCSRPSLPGVAHRDRRHRQVVLPNRHTLFRSAGVAPGTPRSRRCSAWPGYLQSESQAGHIYNWRAPLSSALRPRGPIRHRHRRGQIRAACIFTILQSNPSPAALRAVAALLGEGAASLRAPCPSPPLPTASS